MGCNNVKECSCPKTTCINHGKCCQCVIKHRTTDSLPFCLFTNNELNQIGIKIDMYRQEYRFTPAFAFIQAV